MSYLEYVERAVRGVVLDEDGEGVEGAQVRVEDEGKIVTTTDRYRGPAGRNGYKTSFH